MRFRKLRIAWSVAWGLVCLLAMLLWVRSYRWYDEVSLSAPRGYASAGDSLGGRLSVFFYKLPDDATAWGSDMKSTSLVDETGKGIEGLDTTFHFEKTTSRVGTVWALYVAHWLIVALSGAFTAIPWMYKLRSRFGLRTLLIATTLLAVLFGLIAWAAK